MVRAFREQVHLEKELEQEKLRLVDLRVDFNLYDAFRVFD